MKKSGAKAYLVNTGWNGTGKRISIKDTRGIIDAILDGSILKAETKTIPYFNFEVPTSLPCLLYTSREPALHHLCGLWQIEITAIGHHIQLTDLGGHIQIGGSHSRHTGPAIPLDLSRVI